MIDDEGHHTGIPVFGRIRDKSKYADHPAVEHIIDLAAFGGRPLPRQYLEVVPAIRRPAGADPIPLPGCLSDDFAKRALLLALR